MGDRSVTPCHRTIRIVIAFAVCLALGCDEEPGVSRYRVPKQPTAPAAAQQDGPRPQAGLAWTTPHGWRQVRASSMRLASFAVAHGEETADCSIVRLGGDAGGIVANVNRWRGQVGLEPLDQTDALGSVQNGTSDAGAPFVSARIVNPQAPANAILAAIFPGPNDVVFIKFVGSAAAIEAHEQRFLALCQSIQRD